MELTCNGQNQRLFVEDALGIKLTDWQVSYIWGDVPYFSAGKCGGKTFAYVIKLCLSTGEPLHMYPTGRHCNLCDVYQGYRYYAIFRNYVRDSYTKLKLHGGLKLRTIYFSREQYETDRKARQSTNR